MDERKGFGGYSFNVKLILWESDCYVNTGKILLFGFLNSAKNWSPFQESHYNGNALVVCASPPL